MKECNILRYKCYTVNDIQTTVHILSSGSKGWADFKHRSANPFKQPPYTVWNLTPVIS